MSTDPAEQRIRDEAAAWIVTLHEAQQAQHDARRAECEAWLQRDPRHREIFEQMQAMWQAIDGPRSKRRRRRASVAGLLLVCLIAVLAQLPWSVWQADYRTQPGEVQRIELADHSVLVLNTDTAVDIDFDAERRRVRLLRGEVLARVSHDDASRVFVIATPQGSASALGTRYSVRIEADHTRVAVQESSVRVTPEHAPGVTRVMSTGDAVRLWPDRIEPDASDRRDEPSWVHGRLVFQNTPLTEVVARLARYRRGTIGLAATVEAEDMTFTGVLPATDSDVALAALAGSLGLRVRRFTPYWVWLDTP